MKSNQQFVVYTIKASTIRNFLLVELVAGMGIYYVIKIVTSSVLIATAGSMIGSEGIKRAQRLIK